MTGSTGSYGGAFLKLASLMLDGIPCICSLHEQSLAALLLDLVALKLLGQKQGFLTRLLVAWRGLCLHNACFMARRKAKKVKRQTNKQQSGQQQAAPPQSAKLAGSEPTVEQQGVVPDEEPLLEADFPLPGSLKLPTLMGSPAALARLQPAPRSDAGGLGDATPLASSSHAGVPEAASPLAGKRRGPESVSGSESSEIAEAPSVFFFFFFFFGRERYSLHKCNDSNLKSM